MDHYLGDMILFDSRIKMPSKKSEGKTKETSYEYEKEVEQLIESIKTERCHQDGLIESPGSVVYSSFNSLWGLLLASARHKEEAKQVIQSVKALRNLYRHDGLVATDVNVDGSIAENYGIEPGSDYSSYDNGLWGLLLHAVGYEQKAERVIESVKDSPLYRSDGLVASTVASLARLYSESRNIYSNSNCIWAMLLNSQGYKEEAKKVIELVKSLKGLYQSDGLIASCVKQDGSFAYKNDFFSSSDVTSRDNSMWGLLLHSVGYEKEAKEVLESMKASQLYRPDGIISGSIKLDGSLRDVNIDLGNNSWWGLLLRSLGHEDEAISLTRKIKSARFYQSRDNTNVPMVDIHSDDISLYGLLLLKEGYKVFTGKK